MDQLKASVTTANSYTLVALAGESDMNTSPTLRDILQPQASAETRRLIIDLSELKFIDSTAVHVLMDARAALAARGGQLVLVAPQPVVARVLTLVGADELIPVHADLAEALATSEPDQA